MKNVRCTFTMPKSLFDDLSMVAKGLGVSRSALLANVLTDPIHVMAEAFHDIEDTDGSPESVLRFRGKSAAMVETLYHDFISELSKEEQKH